MKYEYIMKGICLNDGNTYHVSSCANGMSKDEEIEWAKEFNFDLATISITKRKL